MTDLITANRPLQPPLALAAPPVRDRALHAAAQALEASFLSAMLASAGLGETPESFGGGEGEDQFASLLRDEQAQAMTQKGGIGLAESIYQALKRGEGHAD